MKIYSFMGLFFLILSFSSLADVESAYKKLKADFNSNRLFFNHSFNDYRQEKPLAEDLIRLVPDAEFIGREAFYLAYKGRERLIKSKKISSETLLAVADFSQHSTLRRFYLFDLEQMKVVANNYTSHAYNSDKNRDGFPETFSNVPNSETSSLGFMSTGETYYGMWGYSLRLKGLDSSLNSNVYSRAIVIHGIGGMDPSQAAYKSVSTSQGCFMFSSSESGKHWGFDDRPLVDVLIDKMKKGTLVFSYVDGDNSLFESNWISQDDLPKNIIEDEREISYDEINDFDDILPASY